MAIDNRALDTTGAMRGNLVTQIAGEDLTNDVLKTEEQFNYSNITTNATTTVKSGAGMLHTISFNNPSAITVASLTMTIYDNTAASGTKIGTVVVPVGAANVPINFYFDVKFSTGLTIVTAGPTVTADLTISYR